MDDKENDSSKQFLTVQTKNGNTFYMVIDRSGTSENVYMMSLVDENDLAEFLDETEETRKKRNLQLYFRKRLQHQNQKLQHSRKQSAMQNLALTRCWVCVWAAVARWHLVVLAAFAFSKLRKKKEDGIVEEGLEFADDSYINEDEENAEDQQK